MALKSTIRTRRPLHSGHQIQPLFKIRHQEQHSRSDASRCSLCGGRWVYVCLLFFFSLVKIAFGNGVSSPPYCFCFQSQNGAFGIPHPIPQQLSRISPRASRRFPDWDRPPSCPSPNRPRLDSRSPGGLAQAGLCSRQAAAVICGILRAARPVRRSCRKAHPSPPPCAGGRAPFEKVGDDTRGTKVAPEVLRARRKPQSRRTDLSRPFAQAPPAASGKGVVPSPNETAEGRVGGQLGFPEGGPLLTHAHFLPVALWLINKGPCRLV